MVLKETGGLLMNPITRFFRSMRGLTVTNRPLRREGYFQDIVIDPEVPPG